MQERQVYELMFGQKLWGMLKQRHERNAEAQIVVGVKRLVDSSGLIFGGLPVMSSMI